MKTDYMILVGLIIVLGIAVFGQVQQSVSPSLPMSWNSAVQFYLREQCPDDPTLVCIAAGVNRWIPRGSFIHSSSPKYATPCNFQTIQVQTAQGDYAEYCVHETPTVECPVGMQAWANAPYYGFGRCEQSILPAWCGDGIVQAGEECEPPGTETCNEYCLIVRTPATPDPESADIVFAPMLLIIILLPILGGVVWWFLIRKSKKIKH